MAEETVVLNQDVTGTQDNAEVKTPAVAQGAGEVDPQANANDGEVEPEHKRRSGWVRKIEKAEQERDLWREEALRNRQAQPKVDPVAAKPADQPKPKADDFATLDEYIDAVTDWKLDKAAKKQSEEAQARSQAEQSKSRVQKVAETWNAKVAAVKDELKDFEEIAYAPDVPYSPAMTEAVAESDEGARIAYFLGQNLKEAERISKLGPIAAAKEIGKLEARFAKTEQAEGEEKPEPPQTRAPKPPTPISKPSAAKAPSIHDPDLPYKDFVKLREAQKKG